MHFDCDLPGLFLLWVCASARRCRFQAEIVFGLPDRRRRYNWHNYLEGTGIELGKSYWSDRTAKSLFHCFTTSRQRGMTPFELAKKIEQGVEKVRRNPLRHGASAQSPKQKILYFWEKWSTRENIPLLMPLSVLQAFAIAGGFTEWASKKEILLLRNENGQEKFLQGQLQGNSQRRRPWAEFAIEAERHHNRALNNPGRFRSTETLAAYAGKTGGGGGHEKGLVFCVCEKPRYMRVFYRFSLSNLARSEK